jgi:inhibitor of cysteine peptidase
MRLLRMAGMVVMLPALMVAQDVRTPAQKPAVTVSLRDSRRVVHLKTGDLIAIRLDSNPSTGFAWTVRQRRGDVLAQKGMVHESGGVGIAPGAGGTDVWTFEAARTGKERLTFRLLRPGEKDATAAKTAWYSVVVQRP